MLEGLLSCELRKDIVARIGLSSHSNSVFEVDRNNSGSRNVIAEKFAQHEYSQKGSRLNYHCWDHSPTHRYDF